MFRTIGFILTAVLLSLGSIAQNKTLRFNMEVKQLAHMRGGILLIPLQDEPKTSGIAIQRDPNFNRIREHNDAVTKAFSSSFNYCRVGFFYESDWESIEMIALKGVVLNSNRQLYKGSLPTHPDSIFVARIFADSVQIPLQIIPEQERYQRRLERSTLRSHMRKKSDEEWIATKLERIERRLAKNRDRWSHWRYDRAVAAREYYTNYFEPTEFERIYNYFNSENTDYGAVVISRLRAYRHQKNARIAYRFNFSYVARLHEGVSALHKFTEAAVQLNRTLTKKEEDVKDELVGLGN